MIQDPPHVWIHARRSVGSEALRLPFRVFSLTNSDVRDGEGGSAGGGGADAGGGGIPRAQGEVNINCYQTVQR